MFAPLIAPKAPVGTSTLQPRLQMKLSVGSAHDSFEHEADRLSEQVLSRVCACESDDQARKVRRTPTSNATAGEAPAEVHAALRSPGQPLDTSSRAFFETRFGHDFTSVRVHAGTAVEESARRVKAHAYTVGRQIVFGAGQFAPHTDRGRKLLAHELTHVVQQSVSHSSRVQRQPSKPDPADGWEIQAYQLSSPPAGVGLRVPVHPKAVTGIHDFSSDDAIPGRASNRNAFSVGDFRLSQLCLLDDLGASQVWVYRAEGRGEVLAVGPGSLQWFVFNHGSTIVPRNGNSDRVDLPKGLDVSTLPPAPDAFNEEPQIYYLAPRLPAYDPIEPEPQPFRIGIYLMEPYLRRTSDGNLAVLYYMARRQMTEFGGKHRLEYVVGPRWLPLFRAQVGRYAGIAELAFFNPEGRPPPEYVIRSARYVMGVLHNDPERAAEGLKAWEAAAKDPGWWAQVGLGYAGAAQPLPRVQTPNLQVVRVPGAPVRTPIRTGGGSTGPAASPAPVRTPIRAGGGPSAGASITPITSARPVRTPIRAGGGPTVAAAQVAPVRTPIRAGGGPTVAAAKVAPDVAPATPSVAPAAAPRPGPQPVPGVNRVPAPVAPRVAPPPPLATSALMSATSMVTGRQAQNRPVMPNHLSRADIDLWHECSVIHDRYKELQTQVAALSAPIAAVLTNLGANRATEQEHIDFCNLVDEQIRLAEALHKERLRYIRSGCDRFDWFNMGSTEADRRRRHEGEAENVGRQIANLREDREQVLPAVQRQTAHLTSGSA